MISQVNWLTKLDFLQNRVGKVVIFIEKETAYNGLPMTWGRQHNFTLLAFVEAEWWERGETWQQLCNEKIERNGEKKVTDVSNNKPQSWKKNYLHWTGDWKLELEWGCGTLLLAILMKKVSTFLQIRVVPLKKLWSLLCFDVIIHSGILCQLSKIQTLHNSQLPPISISGCNFPHVFSLIGQKGVWVCIEG